MTYFCKDAESPSQNSLETSDASDQDEGGGSVKKGCCGGDGGLGVFPEAAVTVDPGEEALDHPASGLHDETDLVGLAANDL